MKLIKFGLRFWIALTSVFSFLAGWIMLAHAPKPVQPSSYSPSVAPAPTLAPLTPLNFNNPGGTGFQNIPFSVQPQQPQAPSIFAPAPAPIFRTGGS